MCSEEEGRVYDKSSVYIYGSERSVMAVIVPERLKTMLGAVSKQTTRERKVVS